MKHIRDIYPMVKQVRQRIVETMQERGLTEVVIMPDREEWLKQNPDKYEEDYDQTCWDECPYVVYFDKYGCGYEYMVKKVELIGKDALGFPCFRMECEANELGYDRFTNDDVYDMKGVYEVLEKRLGIDEEPEYVWVFVADQVTDDETFDVITEVFATEEAARQHLHDFVYGEEGELAYAEKRGWVVEHNEPDLFRSYEDGYYVGNHTEAAIEKRELKH